MTPRLSPSMCRWLVTLMLAACGDDGSPATNACGTSCDVGEGIGADDVYDDDNDNNDDCQTGGCEDQGGWDTERPPCGGLCASFQECIDEVCLPAPFIDDCGADIQFARLDVELPTPSTGSSLGYVYAVDLGLGEGDDLMLTYKDAIVLAPHDMVRPPFELVAPPDTYIDRPVVGELSGDDIPDLLVPFSSDADGWTLVVHVGDGEGGFTPGPSVTVEGNVARPLLAGDVDGDGHDEVFIQAQADMRWLAVVDGALVDQGLLGPAPTAADWQTAALRFDDMGQAELWTTSDHVRVFRGPPWVDESLALPVPSSALAPLHGRYTGRTPGDAVVVSAWQDRLYVVLGEQADDLHAVEVINSSYIATAGDLDDDGQDDLMLGWQAILRLDEGTTDAPLSAACSAGVQGIEDHWTVYTRHIGGRPQVVGWGNGELASLYEVESTP